MAEQVVRHGPTCGPQGLDDGLEITGVPQYDCRDQKVKAGRAIELALEGSVVAGVDPLGHRLEPKGSLCWVGMALRLGLGRGRLPLLPGSTELLVADNGLRCRG